MVNYFRESVLFSFGAYEIKRPPDNATGAERNARLVGQPFENGGPRLIAHHKFIHLRRLFGPLTHYFGCRLGLLSRRRRRVVVAAAPYLSNRLDSKSRRDG